MDISILIPTYNYVCFPLVKALCKQCQECTELEHFEIIVADDGSTLPSTIEENRLINQFPYCSYIERGTNVGRSIIRAEMVLQMQYAWTIIIDSDAEVCSDSFIQTYVQYAKQDAYDAVCGGILTSNKYLTPHNTLRYKYETNANSIRALSFRNAHPYMHLSTFNIMFRTDIFHTVNFNLELKQYGYEDMLMGIDMEKAGKTILHINNPLIHTGIDNNSSYLHKTQLALQNLRLIQEQAAKYSNICILHNKLVKYHLVPLLQLWHRVFHKLEEANLKSKHPILFVFNLYKIGYFSNL